MEEREELREEGEMGGWAEEGGEEGGQFLARTKRRGFEVRYEQRR